MKIFINWKKIFVLNLQSKLRLLPEVSEQNDLQLIECCCVIHIRLFCIEFTDSVQDVPSLIAQTKKGNDSK